MTGRYTKVCTLRRSKRCLMTAIDRRGRGGCPARRLSLRRAGGADRCGQPGTRRNAPWIRSECDACWTRGSAEDRAEDERRRTEFASREPIEGGFRGMWFSW